MLGKVLAVDSSEGKLQYQSLFYSILRQIVATAFKVYFRKIYLIGKEHMPNEGPILLAANHPMAFSEACLLACFLDRPLHFLVRGDVFKSSWQWFFKHTNQIPIYRFRDGFSNMRKNAGSFDWAYQALADGKAILIFAEGNTKLQKKLSSLQKGTARLAFGAYEQKNVEQTHIVPVGINYTEGTVFRSDVMIEVGEPMLLKKYLEGFNLDKHQATRDLTKDLYERMEPLVIHIADAGDETLANVLFKEAARNRTFYPWPVLDADPNPFKDEKKIANKINGLSEIEKNLLASKMEYSRSAPKSNRRRFFHIILLVLFLPIALIGFIGNAFPFYVAKYIASTKIKQTEFYAPVRITLMIVMFGLFTTIFSIIFGFFLGWHCLWIWPVLMITGYGTIIWYELYRNRFYHNDERGTKVISELLSF